MILSLVLVLAQLAQPYLATTNPSTVVFGASPDHQAVVNGAAVVTTYELAYARAGVVFWRDNVGKPAPNGQTITVVISAQAKAQMKRNVEYTVTVITTGPGGSSSGPVSNTFKFTKL